MKTILVTSGCGFIGSHFVRLLLAQLDLRVVNIDLLTYAGDAERLQGIDGQRHRFIHGDVADAKLVEDVFRSEQPWAIVNFAAESHVDRSILAAAAGRPVRVVDDQRLTPTYTRDLATTLAEIVDKNAYGLYHIYEQRRLHVARVCDQNRRADGDDTRYRTQDDGNLRCQGAPARIFGPRTRGPAGAWMQ